AGNAIGGMIFQWTDGWWKYKQEERLDVHDTNASWPNGGYVEDYVEGDNNMNEEWWGITAKGAPDVKGHYEVYPRAAYYALRQAFRLDPYAPDTDLEKIREHFGGIYPAVAALEARGNTAAQKASTTSRVRVSNVRMEFETYNTGGHRISTPSEPTAEVPTEYPAFLGFGHMESVYADFEAKPTDAVTGRVSVNILGTVPNNPIDEIFYENRGRPVSVMGENGEAIQFDVERVKLYQAALSWDDQWFTLEGFYRTGHLHWQYEGDFFGIYHDAYYGENIDIYNGVAPVGVEIAGKKALKGLKVAYGPELWWAANASVILKYDRRVWKWEATAIYQDDFAEKSFTTSSFAIPLPPTRKLTLQIKGSRGNIGYQLGGIWAGEPFVGRAFQIAEKDGDSYRILEDTVKDSDTFGGKAKVTYQRGRWNWYAQGAIMGIVANGGPTAIPTFTGWRLRDTGIGNQSNIITGIAVQAGDFQISPNFVYQIPMVGPVPGNAPAPGRPRNVLDDPFAVRANREMTAAELLITYDPTPATWMWSWDKDVREDAWLAAAVGYVFRHMPTTQDAAIFIAEDGRTPYPFGAAPPARDLWELWSTIVLRPRHDIRLVATLFLGTAEGNGFDPTGEDKTLNRRIMRKGVLARLAWGQQAFEAAAKFDDWGPYDYHRDFNLTFPVQLMADVSRTLGMPRWFGFPQTKFGVRGTWRSLDVHSPRYCPGKTPDALGNLECDPTLEGPDGTEWEFRTYLHFAM
ncbi:MAG: glycosidase, partial [Candidatus Krumholzibacteria bacterium]|nr:glycosidase [Candidatus Krumholzibacteria bacterium]